MTQAWYSFYVGDYQQKTSHLSLAEHGAYRLLIDHYMATRNPLPSDHKILYRICRVFDRKDRKIVDKILTEFFSLERDEYHNKKCDDVLAKILKYSKSQSAAASAGVAARRSAKPTAESPAANQPARGLTNTNTKELTSLHSTGKNCGGDDKTFFQKCFEYVTERFPTMATANYSPIHAWEKAGYDFEKHVKPAVDSAKAKGAAPRSFTYFSAVISDSAKHTVVAAPPPEEKMEITPEYIEKQKKWYKDHKIFHRDFNPA